jgi:hypothetical protein
MNERELARAVVERAVHDLDLPFQARRALEIQNPTRGRKFQTALVRATQDSRDIAREAAHFLLRDLWRPGDLWRQLIGDALPQERLRSKVRAKLIALHEANLDVGVPIPPAPRPAHRDTRRWGVREDVHRRFLAIAERA